VTDFIHICLGVLAAYALAGALFALTFHGWGLVRLDSGTRGTSLGFRLMITPGVIALWPWLAWLWIRRGPAPTATVGIRTDLAARRLRAWHRVSWRLLAVAVPVVVGVALWLRPQPVPGSKPERFLKSDRRSSALSIELKSGS
jgi:hypothetical protein